jgi:hypothetical protein
VHIRGAAVQAEARQAWSSAHEAALVQRSLMQTVAFAGCIFSITAAGLLVALCAPSLALLAGAQCAVWQTGCCGLRVRGGALSPRLRSSVRTSPLCTAGPILIDIAYRM